MYLKNTFECITGKGWKQEKKWYYIKLKVLWLKKTNKKNPTT